MQTARWRALVAAVASTLVMAGCAAEPPPRSAPDQPESAAVAVAVAAAQRDRLTVRDDWVQLWTPEQAGAKISRCVVSRSADALLYTADPVGQHPDGFPVGTVGVDGSSANAFTITERQQKIVVDGCLASTPVDVRILQVPQKDRDAMYSYDLTVLRHCLLAHGQKVDQLPDRTRFLGMMRAGAPWNAYDRVTVPDRASWYALADACPAFPTAIAGDIAAITTAATTP